MGSAEKRVKDIMARIEEYERIDGDASLCDALQHLKRFYERLQAGEKGRFHKTLFVTGPDGRIIGKLSFYDFVKGLVPEPAKDAQHSRKFYSVLSSRALEVADEIAEMQQRFKWLHTSFFDLVKQEVCKKVRDVMSPADTLLKEEDTINKAIYVMFKENIRQLMVTRDGEIVGVINLLTIFPELLEIAGDECFLCK